MTALRRHHRLHQLRFTSVAARVFALLNDYFPILAEAVFCYGHAGKVHRRCAVGGVGAPFRGPDDAVAPWPLPSICRTGVRKLSTARSRLGARCASTSACTPARWPPATSASIPTCSTPPSAIPSTWPVASRTAPVPADRHQRADAPGARRVRLPLRAAPRHAAKEPPRRRPALPRPLALAARLHTQLDRVNKLSCERLCATWLHGWGLPKADLRPQDTFFSVGRRKKVLAPATRFLAGSNI